MRTTNARHRRDPPGARTSLIYLIGSTAQKAGLPVRSIVVANILGPTDYGAVVVFATVVGYIGALDVGLFGAQNKEIPRLRRADRGAEADDIADVSFTGSAALTITLSAVELIAATVAYAHGNTSTAIVIAALATVSAAQQISGFLTSLSFAEERFRLQASALAVGAAIDWAIVVPVAVIGGPIAVMFALTAGPLAQALVLGTGFRTLSLKWRPEMLRRLVGLGLPIGLTWLAAGNLIAVDRFVASAAFGHHGVGLYAVAVSAASLVSIIPTSLSQMAAPRIFRGFAEPSHSREAILRRNTRTISFVAAATALLAIVLLPIAVRTLLPSFVAGIDPAQVLVVAGAIWAATIPTVTYSIGLGRAWTLVLIFFVAAGANVALDIGLLTASATLRSIALGSVVTNMLLVTILQTVVWGGDAPRRRGTVEASWILLPSLAAGIVGLTVDGALDLTVAGVWSTIGAAAFAIAIAGTSVALYRAIARRFG